MKACYLYFDEEPFKQSMELSTAQTGSYSQRRCFRLLQMLSHSENNKCKNWKEAKHNKKPLEALLVRWFENGWHCSGGKGHISEHRSQHCKGLITNSSLSNTLKPLVARSCGEDQHGSHSSKEQESTSWLLRSASLWTPRGVSRSETWKRSTSMSEAPNLARTRTLSCMSNWTSLSLIKWESPQKTSGAAPSAAAAPLHHQRRRRTERWSGGELGSNPRLLGSGPLGSRRTLTGVFILLR